MLALIDHDPEGGFNVIDTRDGQPLAWRGELSSANEVACVLNATYPSGAIPPAHDSLVHEIVGLRITGEAPTPLDRLDSGTLNRMVPEAIGGPLDPGLWKPVYEEEV